MEPRPRGGPGAARARRGPLLLCSAAAQWLLLLACLTLVGLCYLRSPSPQTQWIVIRPSNRSIALRKPIGVRKRHGTMEVGALNRSIPIHCDGLYLVVLKGTVTLQKAEDPLVLRAYSRLGRDVLVVNCSSQTTEVDKLVVHQFRSPDEIFLEYKPQNPGSQESSTQDLTLSLVMLTPRSYCSPGH